MDRTSDGRKSQAGSHPEDAFHVQNQNSDEQQTDEEVAEKKGDDGLGIRVECSVCNVRLGAQAMTMHLQGKPHLKKIEHFLMEDSKLSWCPICSVQLSSLKQAFSHCMSKQHCEKLVKQQRDNNDNNTKRKFKKSDSSAGAGQGGYKGNATVQGQPIRYPQTNMNHGQNSKFSSPKSGGPSPKFSDNASNGKAEFKCNFCQVTLNGKKQFEQHNMSPKHINTKNSIQKLVNSSTPGGAAAVATYVANNLPNPGRRGRFENRNNRSKPYQNRQNRPGSIGPRPPPPPVENLFGNVQLPQMSKDAFGNPF